MSSSAMLAASKRLHPSMLVACAAWLLACTLWLTPRLLMPDGAGYWAYLLSAVHDGDLLLFDEWRALGMAPDDRFLHEWVTANGHLSNHWSAGAAVARAPGFIAAEIATRLPGLDAFPRDGFRLPYIAAGTALDAFAALATALLGFLVARRFASDRAAGLAGLGILFGSPVLYYGLRGGSMVHALGACVSAVVLALALRLREGATRERWFSVGLAVGFAFALRPQLAALGVLPLMVAPWAHLRAARGGLPAYALGVGAGALPQIAVSTVLHGHPFGDFVGAPGPAGRPFAAFERFWTWEPYLSAWHGLVPWTPFLALGFAGWILLARTERRLAVAAGIVMFTQAFAVATLDRPFWGALAFGQRRLDGLTALLLVGAAVALTRLPWRWAIAVTAACCAWTTGLFLASWSRLPEAEPVTFADLARAWPDAVFNPAAWVPLAGVPAGTRGAAAIALVFHAAVIGLAILALARASPARRAACATAYLLAVTIWVGVCGVRDAARLDTYRDAAERHRQLGEYAGSVDARIPMLRDEAVWYRSRGMTAEADRVDARADDLHRGLLEAARRAGYVIATD